MSILFADDDDFVRDVAEELLSNISDKVYLGENGVQALELYNAHKGSIKLIILDLSMPEMGGCEACSKLRSMGVKVPILAFCAGTLDLPLRR